MTSQYSDPYEEWKAQGRPGGSFSAWQASQAAPQVSGGSVSAPAPAPQSGGVFPWLTQELQRQGANAPTGPRSGGAFPWLTQELQRQSDANAPSPTPGGPGAFNQAWMNEGLAAYNAGQRGSDPLRTPGFDPNTFRQNYAAQAGGNRPEDLARFSNETLAGWMPFYDPGQGKYRSMRGAEGWFDKPTECPPGTGPSGPNETDPCTSQGYSNQPTQAAPPVATAAPVSPLQPIMTGLQGQTDRTTMPTAGGAPSLPQVGSLMSSFPTQTSSLQSLIAPLQSGFVAPTQPQAGLTDMLAGQQKRKLNAWF